MRKLTNNELKEVYNDEDMLKGCINRMCVTNNSLEFNAMYESAQRRLLNICETNLKRFIGSEECDGE